MTQDLLAYTRIANSEIVLEPVDLDGVLDGVIDTYPVLQEARKHITITHPLGICLGHTPSLEQCFSNLLENAVKFAKPGEVPTIEVSSQTRKGHLRVSVLDHGIGIDPRDRERIFGLFERSAIHVEGTGIGLAIVRKGTERMKGRVGLICAPGRPSEFWIDLNLPES